MDYKTLLTQNAGKRAEKLGHSQSAGGNVGGADSYKIKHIFTIQPASCTLEHSY